MNTGLLVPPRFTSGPEHRHTLRSVAPKRHWQSGKEKKRAVFLHAKGYRAPEEGGRPAVNLHRPHLKQPLGFWFNKDGSFPVFIAQHQDTRSIGVAHNPSVARTRRVAPVLSKLPTSLIPHWVSLWHHKGQIFITLQSGAKALSDCLHRFVFQFSFFVFVMCQKKGSLLSVLVVWQRRTALVRFWASEFYSVQMRRWETTAR